MKNYNSTLQSNNLDLQTILNTINALPEAGGELPALANAGTAADLLKDKQLIDGEGNVVTGSFTIDEELATQGDLIAQMQSVLDNLPESGETTTGTCSLTINTNGSVSIDLIGYYSLGQYMKIWSPSSPASLTDVDINQPITIIYHYTDDARYDFDYFDVFNVAVLTKCEGKAVIIQCLEANKTANIGFYGMERG